MFYILIESDTGNACFISDDDAIPRPFESEGDAVKEAKDYSGNTLILKAVASVTDKTTHKVTKLK